MATIKEMFFQKCIETFQRASGTMQRLTFTQTAQSHTSRSILGGLPLPPVCLSPWKTLLYGLNVVSKVL